MSLKLSQADREVQDALSSVDWSKHGFERDYEVVSIEKAGSDVSLNVMDLQTYETLPTSFAVKASNAKNAKPSFDDCEDGAFGQVLDAAGVKPE